jgi:ParB family chromosome partitioning protein
LRTELSVHYTAALREAVASNADIALAVLVQSMASQLLYEYAPQTLLDLRLTPPDLQDRVQDAGECTSHATVDDINRQWLDTLPGDQSRLLGWALAAPRDTLLELLAFLTGLCVNAISVGGANWERHEEGRQIATIAGLRMENVWKPKADGFFARLSKAQMTRFLIEAGQIEETAIIAAMKKPEAAARTHKVLTAAGWLPPELRVESPSTEA